MAQDDRPGGVLRSSDVLKREPSLRAQRPFEICGILVSARLGYPLAGLEVEAHFHEPDAAGRKTRRGKVSGGRLQETLLGKGRSGLNGDFRIVFLDTCETHRRLCLLKQSSGAALVLKVFSSAGKQGKRVKREPVFVSSSITCREPFPVTLMVPLPERSVSRSLWKEFGARLEKARIARVNQVARQLVLTPAANSVFGDWGLEIRHSILAALEQVLLDPRGQLQKAGLKPTFAMLNLPVRRLSVAAEVRRRSKAKHLVPAYNKAVGLAEDRGSIFAVDRILDLNELSAGRIVEAVHKLSAASPGIPESKVSALEEKASERLIPYRDYLLQIFTGSASSEAYDFYRQDIEKRFHQNFGTTDLTRHPVNRILIPIVREILVSKTSGHYGFGMDPSVIKPQGKQSDRNYLDYLVGLSGLSSHDLGLRYRLDLERPDNVHSSLVEENIATLQGFYRDSFQDTNEPLKIFPSYLSDRAPFFLEFEEWVRYTDPFYPENYYQARQPFLKDVTEGDRNYCSGKTNDPIVKWFLQLVAVQDKMNEGHKAYDRQQYSIARACYQEAGTLGEEAIWIGIPAPLSGWGSSIPYTNASAWVTRYEELLSSIKGMPITSMRELEVFENRFVSEPEHNEPQYPFEFGDWLIESREYLQFGLVHLCVYQIPLCLGDCALAMGDYEEAVRQYGNLVTLTVARAIADDFMGYDEWVIGTHWYHGVHDEKSVRNMFRRGSLPYSVSRDTDVRHDAGYAYQETPLEQKLYTTPHAASLAAILVPNYTHILEAKVHRLRFAAALLEWADALYRTDDMSAIARSRELYKGVFWVHGQTPPVFPDWKNDEGVEAFGLAGNPAIRSQLVRARRGFEQIEAGLNYYGCSGDIVPALRYRTLKESADHFTEAAESAQKDFLVYMGNIERIIEQTLREDLVNANMLKKAALQGEIASEQAKIAQAAVNQAKQQVAAVEAAIAAKQEEIAEDDSFWGQFTDFCEGFTKAIESLPGGVTDAASLEGEGGTAGLAALEGGGALAGFAIFAYAGYSSISSMADEDNRLHGELEALQEQALPAARAQVVLRQRELRIASLQGQIAQADADLARSLSAAMREFQLERFLSAEFWAKLAALMKRVMRRYLELGARCAWLAERALAYEQDRSINIVRFDYFPAQLQGVTGADLLKMDLDELEAARLAGLKQTVPIKRTYSLALDFPLAFGQLKKTGRCTFRTEEKPFRLAYPGLYGYRIRAISLEVRSAAAISQARGMLVNEGASLVSRSDGKSHALMRFSEAAPISEFHLKDDMAVYGLPDECLFSFEGSGVDTYWTLEFPLTANPYGLDPVADILITLDLRASYSSDLHEKHLTALPKTVRRMILLSARKQQPKALEELRSGHSPVTLGFDLAGLGLPRHETAKKIANLVILLAGVEAPKVEAELRWGPTQSKVDFKFARGKAFSKGKPLLNPHTESSKLDKLLGKDLEGSCELLIDPAANPSVNFTRLKDVVLCVEYTAHY